MPNKALFVGNTGFSLYHFRLALMAHLRDTGWAIAAVANDEGGFREKFARQSIPFTHVPMDHKGMNPFRDLLLVQRLQAVYTHQAPDLVHHFTVKPVIFGSMAARLARVPAVINTVTGLGYAFEKKSLLQVIVSVLYRVALAGGAKVTFQNSDDRNLFVTRNLAKAENTWIIPGSGVDTDRIRPAARTRRRPGVTFLLASRMLWSKGIREYVQAAAKVRERYPDTTFIMVGGASGGGSRPNPEAISRSWLENLNRSGPVKWIGRVPNAQVMRLLDEADVVVLPSYYPEGVPRSLIEAAAKARAIITTDRPGCRTAVVDGANGFLVPPGDAAALADKMIDLVRNPGLIARMGSVSRQRAVRFFDEKIILEKTAAVYRAADAL